MKYMLITQNNKSKPLINIDYIHVLYKYLFLHEQNLSIDRNYKGSYRKNLLCIGSQESIWLNDREKNGASFNQQKQQ